MLNQAYIETCQNACILKMLASFVHMGKMWTNIVKPNHWLKQPIIGSFKTQLSTFLECVGVY